MNEKHSHDEGCLRGCTAPFLQEIEDTHDDGIPRRKRELRATIERLDAERRNAHAELRAIERAEDRDRYNCSCVRLNKEIDIYDMGEQARANRRGLGCGLVSETFSAVIGCPDCRGTGRAP